MVFGTIFDGRPGAEQQRLLMGTADQLQADGQTFVGKSARLRQSGQPQNIDACLLYTSPSPRDS